MKILIVDDNTKIRKLIIRLINTAVKSYDLLECSDGEQAILINRREHLDLILMDIKMKNMDGLTATRKIHGEQPGTQILIISQLSENEFKEESLKAGATDFLNKDRLYELPDKIKTFIKGKTI